MRTRQFFVFNVALVVAWLLFTIMLIGEYREATRKSKDTLSRYR